MNGALFKPTARTAAIMVAFAIFGTALLAYTFSITRGIIERNEQEAKLALIGQILPRNLYNNNLLEDKITLPPSEELGTDAPTEAYRARMNGKPVAVVFEAIAPDGYGGQISMLVSVLADGQVEGVRVIAHNETPGLGDYIEIAKSKWIEIFDHTSLASVPDDQWRVKKDGGRFDYMTGATITPRAVVKAVHKALEYYDKHHGAMFGLATGKIVH